MSNLNKALVLDRIRPVEDPDIGLSLVDMGLIYEVDIPNDETVNIKMTLSSPACPIGPQLMSMVRSAVLQIDSVKDVDIELVWEPQWNPEEMATDEVKDVLGIW